MFILSRLVLINKKYCNNLAKNFPDLFGAENVNLFFDKLNQYSSALGTKKILEIGGIDRPLLSKNRLYLFHGMDIQSPDNHNKIYDSFFKQSVESSFVEKYDLIYSFTVLEHVLNNGITFKNIFDGLNSHGKTLHYFPSKNHPYSLLLRIIPAGLQKNIIKLLRPWAVATTGYPAYFNFCSVHEIRSVLLTVGFKNINTKCIFRSNDYFSFCLPLFVLVSLWENFCRKFNLNFFAAGIILWAERE